MRERKHVTELATYKMILYSDSTYMYPVDSLAYTNYGDTTFFYEKFQLDGYFRIHCDYSSDFEEGMLKNGQKIGTWRYFDENKLLFGIENYNDMSELHGEWIYYRYINGKFIRDRIFHYVHGNKEGIQKEFYESGALAFCCELDSNGAYINNYLVLYENGDTVYYENFGSSSTGWLKEYNITHGKDVIWEGQLINKKREGWLYSYATDSKTNQRVLYGKSLYKNDTILYQVIYPEKDEKYKGSNIDSITGIYKYDNNEYSVPAPNQIIYYYKGKILGVEKKSSYF